MQIERTLIGIFGKMNAGKSTLMNLLTQQQTSIIDATPGTTADVKPALLELHGLGPTKLFDTPGIDEPQCLGKKKYQAAYSILKEVDLALVVVRVEKKKIHFQKEKELLETIFQRKRQALILFNIDPSSNVSIITNVLSQYKDLPHLVVNLHDLSSQKKIISWIENNYISSRDPLSFYLPHLSATSTVFLNIPMDAETPQMRLLRPQQMIQEYYLRQFTSVFSFRLDLEKARHKNRKKRKEEYFRFQTFFQKLQLEKGKDLLITDSQALDIIHPWTLNKKGHSLIDLTTFSILMINIKSKGRLPLFVEGLKAFSSLKKNDRILIAEACNHDRIQEDIGTLQIPKKIESYFGKDTIQIDHAFGREFSTLSLDAYSLIIHCGGCMIDAQKLQARLDDLQRYQCPITNYGLILAYLESPALVKRVLEPLKITFP